MDEPSGREIKSRVEEELDTEITNGRLYPNLDELVEQSFVEKGALDRRTNYYTVTGAGMEMLRQRNEWEHQMLAQAEDDESSYTAPRDRMTTYPSDTLGSERPE